MLNPPKLSRLSEQPVGPKFGILGTRAMPRRKGSDSQTDLAFSRLPSRELTLQIHCCNCQAQFVAWYGSEDDAETETLVLHLTVRDIAAFFLTSTSQLNLNYDHSQGYLLLVSTPVIQLEEVGSMRALRVIFRPA
jgi:hypothetical protein